MMMAQGAHMQSMSPFLSLSHSHSHSHSHSMPGLATTSTDAHLNLAQANSGAPMPQSLPQGWLQGHNAFASTSSSLEANDYTMPPPPPTLGKRKAETQDNERLSKRLSLLNLEKKGSKLYVPVETPTAAPAQHAADSQAGGSASDSMQVDDSKHKVYIYNLDDELSSESEDEGKLIFLPDIDKHLRENRIPSHIFANNEGELAGMQLVLYSDPRSLSVPEEKDGVRKAIIEARQRVREKQRLEHEGHVVHTTSESKSPGNDDEMDLD